MYVPCIYKTKIMLYTYCFNFKIKNINLDLEIKTRKTNIMYNNFVL